jgi:dynein light intermediate chain 1
MATKVNQQQRVDLITFKLISWRTDILARLSVYTVPSSKSAYTSLLRGFLSPRSLPHTVVIICLDWTKPWTFVEELQTWLLWVEQWAEGDGARDLEIVREENRERRV